MSSDCLNGGEGRRLVEFVGDGQRLPSFALGPAWALAVVEPIVVPDLDTQGVKPSPLSFRSFGCGSSVSRFLILQRGPFRAAKAKEESMFKMTRNDLARKSPAQLSALFNEVNQSLGNLADPSPEKALALSLVAMIRAEQARRDLAPR